MTDTGNHSEVAQSDDGAVPTNHKNLAVERDCLVGAAGSRCPKTGSISPFSTCITPLRRCTNDMCLCDVAYFVGPLVPKCQQSTSIRSTATGDHERGSANFKGFQNEELAEQPFLVLYNMCPPDSRALHRAPGAIPRMTRYEHFSRALFEGARTARDVLCLPPTVFLFRLFGPSLRREGAVQDLRVAEVLHAVGPLEAAREKSPEWPDEGCHERNPDAKRPRTRSSSLESIQSPIEVPVAQKRLSQSHKPCRRQLAPAASEGIYRSAAAEASLTRRREPQLWTP